MTMYTGFLLMCMLGDCQTFKTSDVYRTESKCVAAMTVKAHEFSARILSQAQGAAMTLPPISISVACKTAKAA